MIRARVRKHTFAGARFVCDGDMALTFGVGRSENTSPLFSFSRTI